MKLIDDVIDAVSDLESQLIDFRTSLTSAEASFWLEGQKSPFLQAAREVLCDISHSGAGDGRQTLRTCGLGALADYSYNKAREVNQYKKYLGDRLQALRQDAGQGWKNQVRLQLREALAKRGFARVHLKQAQRQLPLLSTRPARVGFSWYSNGRSIRKIGKREAEGLLLSLDSQTPHIRHQLSLLASIGDSETLAVVRPQGKSVRANVVFEDGKRCSIPCPLPLLFHDRNQRGLPVHNTLADAPTERTRLVRSDARLEEQAWLPSVHVYRYRN